MTTTSQDAVTVDSDRPCTHHAYRLRVFSHDEKSAVNRKISDEGANYWMDGFRYRLGPEAEPLAKPAA